MKKIKTLLIPLSILCALLPQHAIASNQIADTVAPEATSDYIDKTLVTSKKWMVNAAHPLAVEAGAEILRSGGNAIDAMIAVQTVLGLVEPQSSGIGGGSFLVYWDSKNKKLTTFDGRETAPLEVTPTLFQDANGQPLPFFDAVVGGRSVGTPGTVKLLWATHQKYGDTEWEKLLLPAIQLSEDGFEVSSRMAASIKRDKERLSTYSTTLNYFFNESRQPLEQGTLLKNSDYAKTLRLMSMYGENGFYKGELAQNIVNTVRGAKENPGFLSIQDLNNYTIKEREAVCSEYLIYQVCGMGPPSSGAVTLNQILLMTENFELDKWGYSNPLSWQVIADASRLAFADRGRYLADDDFVPVPVNGLLDSKYIKERAQLISPKTIINKAKPGTPPWHHANNYVIDSSIELPSTTHFNIVDAQGNVVSMTSSIENGFGSRLMVGGFLLNNQLTDFSFTSHNSGELVANSVVPGKRPRSSMAPTIVLKENKPYMAIGSPGGSAIIGYVTKALVSHTRWGMNIQDSINLPNIINRFGVMEVEANTSFTEMSKQFKSYGYEVTEKDLNSGLHIIRITENGLEGAADPRREGISIGGN